MLGKLPHCSWKPQQRSAPLTESSSLSTAGSTTQSLLSPSHSQSARTLMRLPKRRRERSVASMRAAGTAKVRAAAAAPVARPLLVRSLPAGRQPGRQGG